MAFHKDGYVCPLFKDKCESIEQYNIRGKFVVSQKPKSQKEYDEAVKYSRILINVKLYKCIYDSKIMENLKNMEEKMYTNI